MRRANLGEMRAFYGAYVAPEGERRQRLSTHVFAPRTAPRTLQLDALPGDSLYPPEPDRLQAAARS